MSPYKYRGALDIGFQLSITISILVANVLNYLFAKIHWGWRLSLGGAMVPSLIITIGSFLPKTPNSMIERCNHEEAKAKLKRIRGIEDTLSYDSRLKFDGRTYKIIGILLKDGPEDRSMKDVSVFV